MRAVLLCGAVLGLCVPGTAQAEEVVLEPSSKWQLDYHPERCRLARTFGQDDRKTVLFLDQHQPSETFTWTMAGQPVATFASGRQFTARFGPALSERDIKPSASTFTGDLEGHGKAVIIHGHLGDTEFKAREETPDEPISLPQLNSGVAGGIEWLELRRGRGNSLRLATGSMGSAFKALNDCMANLVTHWGLDVAAQTRRVTGPEWTNASQVSRRIQRDYPLKALREGRQARIQLRVMIDAAGKPTSCVRTDVTTAEDFTDTPCQIIMRDAEFLPAKDASGVGIPSFYATSVVYQIG